MHDDHLSEEALSMLIDEGQPGAGDWPDGRAHLAGCASCEQRLGEMRVVVEGLRGLPEVEPPRSFVLGPRVVASHARVVRLQRWYVATRALGASLAAVFVLLVGGSAYLDLSLAPGPQPRQRATSQSAPAAPEQAQPAAVAPPATTDAAAPPTPAPRAANAPAGAAAPRAQVQRAATPAANDATPSTDQVIATTAVRPLPTLTPVRLPPPVAAVVREAPAGDPGAPLRVGASVAGVLAALSLLLTLVVRHRLRQARLPGAG